MRYGFIAKGITLQGHQWYAWQDVRKAHKLSNRWIHRHKQLFGADMLLYVPTCRFKSGTRGGQRTLAIRYDAYQRILTILCYLKLCKIWKHKPNIAKDIGRIISLTRDYSLDVLYIRGAQYRSLKDFHSSFFNKSVKPNIAEDKFKRCTKIDEIILRDLKEQCPEVIKKHGLRDLNSIQMMAVAAKMMPGDWELEQRAVKIIQQYIPNIDSEVLN